MSSLKTASLISALIRNRGSQTHLELPFFFLHHCSHYVEGGIGEAEHQEKRQLVLNGQDENIIDERGVRKPRKDDFGLTKQMFSSSLVVDKHDGLVHCILDG